MRGLQTVSLAILIWGSQSFARLPAEGSMDHSQQLQTIQSWTAQLNFYVSGLNLKVTCKLDRAQVIEQVLNELQALRASVNSTARLPKDSLMHLACTRPECGGGGGSGGCKTCFVPETDPNQDRL